MDPALPGQVGQGSGLLARSAAVAAASVRP